MQTADVLTPYGSGAAAAANYSGNTNGAAAIQYDGTAGGGKVVYFGFPFETITAVARRDAYMADILTFFLAPIPATIITPPLSQTVNQGANATFTVVATGTAPLDYQWVFGGTNIQGATASSYLRSNAQAPDAGEYSVIVTNTGGAVTSGVATLTLNFPPVITAGPDSQIVTQGSSATFSVQATGTAPLSYQWRMAGTNLPGATGTIYTRANAQPADAGSYSVTVSNMVSLVLSSNAVLTVLVPPSIITQPQNQGVVIGANATFTVGASGTAPLSYQWRFEGANIGGATESSYTRMNVQPPTSATTPFSSPTWRAASPAPMRSSSSSCPRPLSSMRSSSRPTAGCGWTSAANPASMPSRPPQT